MDEYPLNGKIVIFDYGKMKYRMDFTKKNTVTFQGISKSNRDRTDTMKYKLKQVGDGVFVITWTEPKHKDMMTQIHNLKDMIVISSIYNCKEPHTFIKGKIKFELQVQAR